MFNGRVSKITRRNWQQNYNSNFRATHADDVRALGGTCELCGKPARPGDPLQRHHKIRKAQAGPDIRANYMLVHESCHMRLHPRNRFFK